MMKITPKRLEAAQAAVTADHQERDRSMEPSASPSRQRLSRAYQSPARLGWLRGLYAQNSRRHNLEAVVAYGSYKSSSHAGSPANEATHIGVMRARPRAPSRPWEDEGGATLAAA